MSLQQYVRQVKPRNESYTPPVDKVQNFLTEGLKAEDYEAAVVMGWYEIHNRKLDSKTGIADKTFKTLEKSPDALETGRRIAQYILKNNSSLTIPLFLTNHEIFFSPYSKSGPINVILNVRVTL